MTRARNLRMRKVALFVSAACLGLPVAVVADEAADQKKVGPVLEEVVVTATKTGETDLQKTAMAISYLATETLESLAIQDARDIEYLVASMQNLKVSHLPTVFMRGVGSVSSFPGQSDGVSVYVDDVYTARYTGMQVGLLDLQGVEVLRGPQGTLYGRNSNGGAIRYITAMPGDDVNGYVDAEFGNVNKIALRAAAGGPLVGDTVKGRIAVARESRDGFIEDLSFGGGTIDDMTRTAGRARLQFTPSDRIDIVLSADYQKYENEGGILVTEGASPDPLIAAGAVPFKPFESLAHDIPNEGYEHETELYSLVMNFQLPGDVSLKSITGLGTHVYDAGRNDRDMTSLAMTELKDFTFDYDTTTQEFQLNGAAGAFTWVGGLFYLNEEQGMYIDSALGPVASPLPVISTLDDSAEWKSYAAYLSASYAVNEQLAVTAGVRYTYDEMSGNMANQVGLQLGPTYITLAKNVESVKSDWDDVSPKIGLEYQYSDDVFLYGTISKGYKAGGFDLAAFTPAVPPYDPEEVWSYEVGARTESFENRLRANLTLFYYDYNDMQVRSLVPTGLGVAYQINNAGKATVMGAELELVGSPVENLTLGANVTYLDGTYDELIGPDMSVPTPQPTDMSGNELIWTPPWAVNAFGTYDVAVQDKGMLTFTVNYSWKDKMYQDPLNDELRSYDPRSNLDASVRFAPASGNWSVNVYGRNLTDEVWFTSKSPVPYGPAYANPPTAFWGYITPDRRQYGVILGYRF